MTPNEFQVRLDICQACSNPCEPYARGEIRHGDACESCPRRIWHAHGDCEPNKPRKIIGMGDLVHAVALPIARALNLGCVDKTTGKLRPESACEKRRQKWNSYLTLTASTPPTSPSAPP